MYDQEGSSSPDERMKAELAGIMVKMNGTGRLSSLSGQIYVVFQEI